MPHHSWRLVLVLAGAAAATGGAAAASDGAPAVDPAPRKVDGARGCVETIRFGVVDGIAPLSVAPATAWLDDAPDLCFAWYRQPSGPVALEKISNGDLDFATMGSVPFTTAIERGAPVSAIGILAIQLSAEGLATRYGLQEPRSLRGSTIATVRGSTSHYMFEAFLLETGIDPRDVTLVFAAPKEITRLWDAGAIDGAACWTPTLDHVLATPHGATGTPALVVYDAETLRRWGYRTGVLLVARDDFVARLPDVAQRVVERVVRAAYAYNTNPNSFDWTAGRYADVVGRSFWLELGNETTFSRAAVAEILTRNTWPGILEQMGFRGTMGAAILRRQAAFLFAQKDLAETPYEDAAPYLDRIDISFLSEARLLQYETIPLDADPDPVPDFVPYAVRAQMPVPGEGCESFTVLDDENATFDDGSTGEHAYARNANCVWALRAPATGCVALDVPFLSSEGVRDRVEVFSATGDLRATFFGRRGGHPTTVGCVVADAPPPGVAAALVGGAAPDIEGVGLYVRWSTDDEDELAMGAIEPVGFRATARAIEPQERICGPGRGGALCDAPYCVGVVEVTGEGGVIKTQVADDAYQPNSRCAWRIPARGGRVVLDVARLGLERVRDVVTIYDGGAAPPGFNTLARPPPVDVFGRTNELSRRTRYRMSGTHAPSTPLVFDNDVFVTFESDGIANGPRDGGPAGLEIRWRRDVVDGDLCPEAASCGRNGRCEEGVCVCDTGYYGETCAFDACVGAAVSDLAPSGRIVSSAGVDYPPDMNCEWFLDIPGREGEGIAGIRLRFDRFDIEAPEGQATTTDRAVVFYSVGPQQGSVLCIFRRVMSQQGQTSAGAAVDPATDETKFTFDDGDTLEVLLPEPAAAGANVQLMLGFETDANNHRPFSGFDVTYGVRFHGGLVFCDEIWPCADGEVCKQNGCVPEESKSSRSRRSRRKLRQLRRGVAIAALVFACVMVLALCVFFGVYARRVVRTKDELETERVRVVRDQVDSARQWVEDFQAPFCVVAADTFIALGALRPHEALRDGPRDADDDECDKQHTRLEFYDSVDDVERARRGGAVFVFLSHQWLGHAHPDPAGIHYKAMCRALQAVAEDAGVALSAVRAWVDVSSIPQANQATQSLAVASLPTFASCVDYFIVVAPDTEHVTTGCGCDAATYRKRAWCRAEVVACWARRGADRMFVATNRGLRPLFVDTGDGVDTYLEECLEVFAGDLTCCRLQHPDGEPCDKEALVPPFLGLIAELYRDRKQRPEAWAKVRDRADELFPRTFSYESGGVTTTLPLFGDLIEAILRLVDSEGTDGASPEPVLRGLAPGTTGQRHVAKAHRRSPHQHSRHLVATAPHSGDGSTLRGSRDAGSLRGSPGVLFRALSDRVVRRSPPAALRELPTASPAVTERSTAATVATAASAATVATTETPRDNWASSPPASPWSSTSLWSSSRSPESKTGSSERRLTWALPTGRAERPRVSTVSLQPVLPTVEDV
mmetsp:Transcript_31836/g.98326  ORF Transcript_31836/g.98326 Transcript_31836/m.98326 type:complete len:1483 (-) Transcript_31836:122-4570(-)